MSTKINAIHIIEETLLQLKSVKRSKELIEIAKKAPIDNEIWKSIHYLGVLTGIELVKKILKGG